MKRRLFLKSSVALLSGLTANAASALSFRPYQGPKITRLVVYKERRKLYLLHGHTIIKSYKIGLGFNPIGHKRFEGDGKTPEGSYFIDRRNPNSNYHLSLGISYPNIEDRSYASTHGKSAGGDIFIHGRAGKHRGRGRDWTWGCIAVKDRHIEEIFTMVENGTQIDIHA